MKRRPFFIVGAARSGTTLLRHLLNRHSEVCVPEETHFIPQKLRPFVRLLRLGRRRDAIEFINASPIIQRWGIRIQAEDLQGFSGEDAYSRAIHILMVRRAKQEDKTCWGEKTPRYLWHIDVLHRLFPEARFICIYRDGRDVALSVIPLRWGPNNVYACARWWQAAIKTWFEAKKELGNNGMDLSYEELTVHPASSLRRICRFLELPYEDKMLINYPIKKNNFGKWKDSFNMTKHELNAFEYVAGDTLKGLGYNLGVSDPNCPFWLRLFFIIDNSYKTFSNQLLREGIYSEPVKLLRKVLRIARLRR